MLNKDNFDTELADAERIEVLRGPQSTLYGRNTMGGVVNVYTLSPLTYEGVRLTAEYGSGDSYRFRASSYYKLSPDLGMAVTGYFTHTGGFFDNDCTGEECDWERLGGGRWKTQWRNNRGVRIDNTFSFSALDQGGYPYAYAGEDIVRDGKTVIRNGQISYNDPSSYRRTTVSDGLTVRYDAAKYSVSSITSYQYSDDEMTLDQDFTPESWFTLRQARREHALTEDIVFRSHDGRRYGWLLGAFGFYRHGVMEAPVHFKRTGIEELILKNANEHDPQYTYDAWDNDELLLGSRFRKYFIAPQGETLLDADYSQIELRLLAHISGDEAMCEAFRSGADIHRSTAARIYGLPPEQVTPALRSSAKAVNFGIVYGIGAFSLSKDIGVSVKEADAFIKNYFANFPGVKKYLDETVEQGRENGYVTTLYGRRRTLPELASSNFNVRSLGERMAMNTPIQGTAADIIKLAMVRVYRRLKAEGLRARLILQVHDELIVECPAEEKECAAKVLGEEMRGAAELRVPLSADVNSGTTWYVAKG